MAEDNAEAPAGATIWYSPGMVRATRSVRFPLSLLLLLPAAAVGQPAEQPPGVLAQVHGVFRPLGGSRGLSGEVSGAPAAEASPDVPAAAAAALAEGVIRHRRVDLDFELLRSRLRGAEGASRVFGDASVETGGEPPDPVVFNFFDDAVAVVDRPVVQPVPVLGQSGWVLTGPLVGDVGWLTLSVHTDEDGTLTDVHGFVEGELGAFEVARTAPGIYTVIEVDPSGWSDLVEHPDDEPAGEQSGGDADAPPEAAFDLPPDVMTFADYPVEASATSSTIDVLVLTTSRTRSQIPAWASKITTFAANTNTAFANSGVSASIRVIRHDLRWNEGTLLNNEFLAVIRSFYGNLGSAYGADLVHMIAAGLLSSPSLCGHAYIGPGSVASYGVTFARPICGNYSFAHQIGHNLGLRHDRYSEFVTTPQPNRVPAADAWAYGYNEAAAAYSTAGKTVSGSCWRTIMSHSGECAAAGATSAPRIPYFSNLTATTPSTAGSVTITSGDAMGVAGSVDAMTRTGPADAARTLKANVGTVAALRTKAASPQWWDLTAASLTRTGSRIPCWGDDVALSFSISNSGTATSSQWTYRVSSRWKATASASWPRTWYPWNWSTTQAVVSSGDSRTVTTYPVVASSQPGYQQFRLEISPSSSGAADPLHGKTIYTSSSGYQIYDDCSPAGVSVSVTKPTRNTSGDITDWFGTGFKFRIWSQPPHNYVQSHKYRVTTSWTPTDQYTRTWIWQGETERDRGSDFHLQMFYTNVDGYQSDVLPFEVWATLGRWYHVYVRHDGGYRTAADDKDIALTLLVTRVSVGTSWLTPGGDLVQGGAEEIPVELQPLTDAELRRLEEAVAGHEAEAGPFGPPPGLEPPVAPRP